MSSFPESSQSEAQNHAFLLRTAELLHQYGTPSFRLEGVMGRMAQSLNIRGVFLYTPTALVVALGSGSAERTYLRRVDAGDVDISKVLAFDATLEDLESGRITVSEAADQLETIANAPPAFPLSISLLAAALACAGVAVIIGGNAVDVMAAGCFGFVLAWITTLSRRSGTPRGWLEPVLGFGTAITAVIIGRWLPIDDRLVTLAALILPIPGLAITIALTELATGHLSSGSARLAGALVTLFTLVVGVAIAWRFTANWTPPQQPAMAALPPWCLWVAIALTPAAFAVVFKAPLSQWPAILSVVVCGFLAGRITGDFAGSEVGAFMGALVVGCGSNAYARIRNRPAMVPQTPGLLILVPGSIGYKSLTALVESDTLHGVELAFSMAIIGVSLAGGLLLANQIISPRRIL
ncbi:MAG: threonine/serine exporter family protein [Planctomycetaceae bacterium]